MIGELVYKTLCHQVVWQTTEQVEEQVEDQTWWQVREGVEDQVRWQVGRQVWLQVEIHLKHQARALRARAGRR